MGLYTLLGSKFSDNSEKQYCLHFRVSSEIYTLLHLIFCVIAVISPQCMPVPNRPLKLYFHKYQKDFSGDKVKEVEMCGVCGMHGVEKKYA